MRRGNGDYCHISGPRCVKGSSCPPIGSVVLARSSITISSAFIGILQVRYFHLFSQVSSVQRKCPYEFISKSASLNVPCIIIYYDAKSPHRNADRYRPTEDGALLLAYTDFIQTVPDLQ